MSNEIKVCDKVKLTMDTRELHSVCLPPIVAGAEGVIAEVSDGLSGKIDPFDYKVRITSLQGAVLQGAVGALVWLRKSMLTVIEREVSSEDGTGMGN
jgi:hypothetical protein